MDYRFEVPTKLIIGAGCSHKLRDNIRQTGVQRSLLVSAQGEESAHLFMQETISDHAINLNEAMASPFDHSLKTIFTLPITFTTVGDRTPDWIQPGLISSGQDPVYAGRHSQAERPESNGGPS